MNEKEAKLELIGIGLAGFCDEYLNLQAEEPIETLFFAAVECEELNLTRGDPNVWAAAIAYAFCRMNFVLDGGSPSGLNVTRDEFFSFFEGCNRSTITQKATKVERALEFHHGHPYFSLPDVVDGFPRIVELPSGLIDLVNVGRIPVEISMMDEEESRRLEEELRERARLAEDKKRKAEEDGKRKRLAALEKKREEERKIQPELFDL